MEMCDRFGKFMADQKKALSEAFDEDKWYLSEKEHRDVGDKTAQTHFLDCHIERWAARFRETYCESKCDLRNGCKVKKSEDKCNVHVER